jgi:5'-nucleotidase
VFLAGPEFNASLVKGPPFYDATALSFIGYDAMAIGNHEFDFGPDVLADFIESFKGQKPIFLSANLDVSGEPRLQALASSGRIAHSTVVIEHGERIGVVGATTPNLPFISSPGNVVVLQDVAAAVQAEIDMLEAEGVNKIVLVSHLQGLNEDAELVSMLRGVDIAVGGGGDELLANDDDILIPGHVSAGPYPMIAMGADGHAVPLVTAAGGYLYVGRLIVGFDEAGNVVRVDDESGPVRVAGGASPDAVDAVQQIQQQVVNPVEMYVDGLATNIIATAEVALDGRRAVSNPGSNEPIGGLRFFETNEGNLVADAFLWQATQLAPSFGAPVPDVALANGGGIRNNDIIPAGPFSEFETFRILPFLNFITVVENIPAAQFVEILENAVSRAEDVSNSGTGRFAQIAGFTMEWDPTETPMQIDIDGNVTQIGSRVREVLLDDGTVIVANGVLQAGAPSIDLATVDFLAKGGDQYPFRDRPFTLLGVTYQQALSNYIQQALGSAITATQYPEGGEGRIIKQ